MTFVEAAMELLTRRGTPIAVAELAELAVAEGLISKETKNPVSAMKGRLTTELKRGADSRVVEVEKGVFALANGTTGASVADAEAPAASEPGDLDVEDIDDEGDADDDGYDDDDEYDDEDDGEDEGEDDGEDEGEEGDDAVMSADDSDYEDDDDADEDEDEGGDADDSDYEDDDDDDEEDDDEDDDDAAVASDDAADDDVSPVAEAADDEADQEAPTEAIELAPNDEDEEDEEDEEDDDGPARRPAEPTSDEEREMAEIYAGEDETRPAAALNEYSDAQTADEDRPMLPAIRAERPRNDRRSRGGSSSSSGGAGRDKSRRRRSSRRPRPESGSSSNQSAADLGPNATLIDQIAEVVGAVGDRSIGLKQVASELRKNFDCKDEDLQTRVRRTVLAHAASMSRHQLRPRVVFRDDGRLVTGTHESPELARAVLALEGEARVALAHKLSALSSAKLEALTELWLEHVGYRDLGWVKRVQTSSYATALAPEQVEPMLISVRAGGKPVDRRGVGELRAGIVAKRFASGALIAPQPLSPEASVELSKDGPPILTICGPAFTRAIIDAGFGVATRAITVRSIDDAFFSGL